MIHTILNREPNLKAKKKPFCFQAEAVKDICGLDYAALFHEQGLGKSKIAIDLALYWLENKVVDAVLVVVKKSLIYNWEREFKLHSHLQPKVISQNHRSNYFVFNSPAKVFITNYEVLVKELNRFKLFFRCRSIAVILDEATKIKNPLSIVTKAAFELSYLMVKRVIMTGTPIANRPYDIWAPIWFLDHGKSLGNDFKDFKNRANFKNDMGKLEEPRRSFENFISTIHQRIHPFTIRMTKESGVLTLPQKTYKTIYADWEREQHKLYLKYRNDAKATVLKDKLLTIDNADVLLKKLLRLLQITSNPHLVDQNYESEPGKIILLNKIIKSILNTHEKCIIWTSFTENVEWLFSKLSSYGVCKIHGKMTIQERNRSVKRFLEFANIRIMVATPGAAKEGLTLTVANHVIFYDRSFSLDDYLQAQDRIHRISQHKNCYIYNIIMKNSIDEWVDKLIEGKRLSARLAQGDITLEEYRDRMDYDFIRIFRDILGIS